MIEGSHRLPGRQGGQPGTCGNVEKDGPAAIDCACGAGDSHFVFLIRPHRGRRDRRRTRHHSLHSRLIVFLGVTIALLIGACDLGRLRTQVDREEKRNLVVSQGLADSIDAQMDEWRMTSSEKDVAWLIIKGYCFAEIAKARGVKENTSRLQATAIYAKAGVSGRAEFVAEIIQSYAAAEVRTQVHASR